MLGILKVIGLGVVSLFIVFAAVLGTNYFNTSIKIQKHVIHNTRTVGPVITVMDWNIGYAGLGKDSDFIMDGGENLLPPSREIVEVNLNGIADIMKANPADFYIIQEVSKPDMLNMGVDVLDGVRAALPDHSSWFTYDFSTRFIPTKWALKHGLSSFTPFAPDNISVRRLPNEPEKLGGIIGRQYHVQITEFKENGRDWALLNIHLSAFDEGGNIRVQQLEKLLEIAAEYYADGKHVIIGGDWNMQLTPTDFPNNTEMKQLFWLKVLPKEKIPSEWQLAFDTRVATVRTNYQPYIKGENYTTIIDGFLVSPNVEVVSVEGIDTNFEFTDHQPVLAQFTARP